MNARTKSDAQVNVPQTRQQAVEQLNDIGEIVANIERLEITQTLDISEIKRKTELAATPLKKRLKLLQKGLKTFCEANRAALTNNSKVKSHDFGTGIVKWRAAKKSVQLSKPDDVLKRLLAQPELKASFVRTKSEINREALLDDPDAANKIEGVKIKSSGETFIIEPLQEKTGVEQ